MNAQISPDKATLANWRQHPWSSYAFSHVEELIHTHTIAAPAHDVTAFTAGPELDLASVWCDGPSGRQSAAQLCTDSYTDGLMVVHRGRVVAAHYYGALSPARRHIAFSISKSLTGLLAGIMAGHQWLDSDAPVSHYLPGLPAHSAYRHCRVRHLLDMTASLRFSEVYLDPGDMARYRKAMAWDPRQADDAPGSLHDFLQNLPGDTHPHGDIFHYASPNSDVLGWVLEQAGHAPLAELLTRWLWQPLGAEHDAWITIDHQGAARSAGGIGLTLADLARVGELVRHQGQVNGRQVVPDSWLQDMWHGGTSDAWRRGDLTGLFPHATYRSQWYRPQEADARETLYAIGIHGQWLYIDRTAELTVAKFSCQPVAADDPLDQRTLQLLRGISRYFS